MTKREMLDKLLDEVAMQSDIEALNQRVDNQQIQIDKLEDALILPQGILTINEVVKKYKVGRSTIHRHIKNKTLKSGEIYTGETRIKECDVWKMYHSK